MGVDYEETKRKLIEKKQELGKMMEDLLADASDVDVNELSSLDTNHLVDSATNMINREEISGKLESIKVMLLDIEHALAKLEKNKEKFGLCELCNKPIEEQRLAVIPWSRYCIACKTKLDKRR
ncbi:MAG TPA: TraR/DksA C4-type zinc finger protein [Acetomicrobium flavidum]|uniref:DnaK suppressor protein n=2 Tax=Acetomicrobium TaxID=49894 RepID=I4BW98_ACEMN|nr:TraR/DksA C4-type zinc finger protein [Acetomicrobium mobile]AFM21555.1 DnaK suppressor protein [Acetomicrobium mobile DSM 13181]NLG93940.1 DNA-binding protein [Acetomicrobium flavidum]SIN62564.1 transcriptional regulator, TraR/DksA family [Acetomicrobium flavidum]HOJ82910.1 TraR/DksA C4-type zinc finger protein [Acetomicrobium flavidum]